MGEVEADRCSRLFAEGLERVLERRDLLLAPGRALGEVHARVETGRLELVEILQRRVELLLRALEVAQGLSEIRFRGDLLLALRFELLDRRGTEPFELTTARSRLYRSQILQVNTRWEALAEIYTMHSFAPFFNLKISAKNRQHFFAIE